MVDRGHRDLGRPYRRRCCFAWILHVPFTRIATALRSDRPGCTFPAIPAQSCAWLCPHLTAAERCLLLPEFAPSTELVIARGFFAAQVSTLLSPSKRRGKQKAIASPRLERSACPGRSRVHSKDAPAPRRDHWLVARWCSRLVRSSTAES